MTLKDDSKAYAIMGCAIKVHSTLGDGFLESAYGDALEVEFRKAGIPYVREDSVRIYYDGQPLPTNYRADFTCFDRNYIVELKAIKQRSQTINSDKSESSTNVPLHQDCGQSPQMKKAER